MRLGTRILCLIGVATGLVAFTQAVAAVGLPGPQGAWYLALDAEPFGLPPGTNLPGMATFDQDHSFHIVDGGDFGGMPFTGRDTAQFGSWHWVGGHLEAVSLFIEADAITGQVQSWQRVHLLLTFDGLHRMVGTVNVSMLPCDLAAPFPVFGCPDPVASAGDFVPVPPFDIPVALRQLPPTLP